MNAIYDRRVVATGGEKGRAEITGMARSNCNGLFPLRLGGCFGGRRGLITRGRPVAAGREVRRPRRAIELRRWRTGTEMVNVQAMV